MNLMGQEYEEKDIKTKKVIKISIIVAVIALFIVLGVYMYIYYLDSQNMKMAVDGKQTAITENLYIVEQGGKIYVSVEDFAKIVGYKYYHGEYGKYNEDTAKCYLQNDNEVAGFEVGSNRLYKIDPTDSEANNEWYELDEPVRLVNNKIYCTSDAIQIACNVQFKYDQDKNRVQITTLDRLVEYYKTVATTKYGYTGIDTTFANQKALLYNMMIIIEAEENANGKIKEDTAKYGVITLDNKTLIGTKYDNIEFIEVMQEFFVTSAEKVGILSKEGAQKIDINYDAIRLLDNELRLYYVVNNNSKGVLDKNGKRIAYIEYEQIGIDSSKFTSNDIENDMLLYNNCIPVMKNEKWGIIDKNGNQILDTAYDSLGYIAKTSKDTAENNLLIIPEIEGIVICQNEKYGIINSSGKMIAPCQFDKIYSITNLGKDTYYLVYGAQTLTLEEYQQLSNQQTTTQEQPTNTSTSIDNTTLQNQTTEVTNSGVGINTVQ